MLGLVWVILNYGSALGLNLSVINTAACVFNLLHLDQWRYQVLLNFGRLWNCQKRIIHSHLMSPACKTDQNASQSEFWSDTCKGAIYRSYCLCVSCLETTILFKILRSLEKLAGYSWINLFCKPPRFSTYQLRHHGLLQHTDEFTTSLEWWNQLEMNNGGFIISGSNQNFVNIIGIYSWSYHVFGLQNLI